MNKMSISYLTSLLLAISATYFHTTSFASQELCAMQSDSGTCTGVHSRNLIVAVISNLSIEQAIEKKYRGEPVLQNLLERMEDANVEKAYMLFNPNIGTPDINAISNCEIHSDIEINEAGGIPTGINSIGSLQANVCGEHAKIIYDAVTAQIITSVARLYEHSNYLPWAQVAEYYSLDYPSRVSLFADPTQLSTYPALELEGAVSHGLSARISQTSHGSLSLSSIDASNPVPADSPWLYTQEAFIHSSVPYFTIAQETFDAIKDEEGSLPIAIHTKSQQETLGDIADRYLGDEMFWPLIASANSWPISAGIISEGDEIIIPKSITGWDRHEFSSDSTAAEISDSLFGTSAMQVFVESHCVIKEIQGSQEKSYCYLPTFE